MDQGVAWQAQAKMPLKLPEGVKQPLMYKAAISEQGDKLIGRQEGMHLIEHGLIGFKAHLGTSVVRSSPRQRNRPTTRDQGGTDQHKGREGCGIQCNIETLIGGPVSQSSLDHRPIPL